MDKNKIAVGVFDKLATLYQEKFMDVNLYSYTFDFFCDTIEKQNAGLLEIACGPGNIAQAHTKDEFLTVADLEAGADFYRRFLETYRV